MTLTRWQAGVLAETVVAGQFHVHNGLDRACAQQLAGLRLLRRLGRDTYQATDAGRRAAHTPAPALAGRNAQEA